MTVWEKKIIDAFISHYFASAQKTAVNAVTNDNAFIEDNRHVLRLRSSIFFPNFDTINSD